MCVYSRYEKIFVDFNHLSEFMGQPSYVIHWGFQTGVIAVPLAGHLIVLLGQLFLADGVCCKTNAFHRAILLSEFFNCKVSCSVTSDVGIS